MSTLSSLSPALGGLDGGTAVTLYGSNFPVVGNVTMRFGSDVYVVPVDDSLSSATVMYCSAPGPFSGHADVQVSMYVGGYLLSTNAITYGYRGELCMF